MLWWALNTTNVSQRNGSDSAGIMLSKNRQNLDICLLLIIWMCVCDILMFRNELDKIGVKDHAKTND